MMRNIVCVAVDDEPMALSVISSFCSRAGGMDLTTFTDPEAALDFIQQTCPDLVFLDIEMGRVNGMDVAAKLPAGTFVILTTAYKQYALDGYDIGVVDFLHKPFPYSRFETAIGKVRTLVGYRRKERDAGVLTVKEGYMNVSIPFSDIIFIEAMNNYCRIQRENGVCTMSRISLKVLMTELPETEFVRIHRSFVVARSKVEKYTRKEILLSDGSSLPVGRMYADEISVNLG